MNLSLSDVYDDDKIIVLSFLKQFWFDYFYEIYVKFFFIEFYKSAGLTIWYFDKMFIYLGLNYFRRATLKWNFRGFSDIDMWGRSLFPVAVLCTISTI